MNSDDFERKHTPGRLVRPVLIAFFVALATVIGLVVISMAQIDGFAIERQDRVARQLLVDLAGKSPAEIVGQLQAAGYPDAAITANPPGVGQLAVPLFDRDARLAPKQVVFTPFLPARETFRTNMAWKLPLLGLAALYLIGTTISLAFKLRTLQARRKEARLLATTDPVSGLANSRWFLSRLAETMDACPDEAGDLALYFVGLSEVKRHAGTQGDNAGDIIVRSAAERLRQFIGKKDFAAQISTGEFAVIRVAPGNKNEVLSFGRALVRLLSMPYDTGDGFARVAAAVGVAIWQPREMVSETAFCRAADRALSVARSLGPNQAVRFSPEMLEPLPPAAPPVQDVA